ncbi:hypothetical protein SKAU_G00106050 [Synaphobranchus kaupii]|uniref:Uncharacterized protein n=1 Tax=Synaphobranchus kaupii TaxID=118154 RepID=A0A9Q1J6V0_SYNKA|nr:hypothetical protein SKAU_G00106050 [Synaphobranchus kaupii]
MKRKPLLLNWELRNKTDAHTPIRADHRAYGDLTSHALLEVQPKPKPKPCPVKVAPEPLLSPPGGKEAPLCNQGHCNLTASAHTFQKLFSALSACNTYHSTA